MTELKLQSHAVWDRSTRWFHWINFACVVALVALGTAILYAKELGVTDDGKILLKTTHVLFGYVFAVNLAWRIVCAFIGNRRPGSIQQRLPHMTRLASIPHHGRRCARSAHPLSRCITGTSTHCFS